MGRADAAKPGISLTTSPVVLNLAIPPGTSDTRTLQLMNNGSQSLPITMKLDVFGAKGDSGDATITEPLADDPSINWVSFSPSSFTAKPGVWSSVKMTISLPKAASLGYYFAVLFKPDVSNQQTPNATQVRGTNAILVLVDTHSGDENRKLDVTSFQTSQQLYEYLPASFSVTIRNKGNIYTAPTGNIYISRNSDLTDNLAAIDVNPGEGNILPHTSRTYSVAWTDGFPMYEDKKVNGQTVYDDHNQPVRQLSWNFGKLNKIRIGKYYAKVTVIYNDGKRVVPVTRVISFWVIPWKLLLVLLVIVIILAIGLLAIGWFILHVLRRNVVYRL